MNNSIKSALHVFSGNSARYIVGFITGIAIARILGPHGKGIFTSLILIPGIICTIGELGTRQATMFFLGRKIFNETQIVNTSVFLILFLSIPLVAICFLLFNTYYAGDFSIEVQLIILLYIPITLMIKVFTGIFLGEGKIGVFNRVNWIPALVNLILVLFLAGLLNMSILGLAISLIFSQSVILIYGLVLISREHKFNFSFFSIKIAKALFLKGIIFALALFAIQLNYRIDVIILRKMVSYSEIGLYSIGISLAEIFWQIPTAISIVIMSKSATSQSENQKYIVAKTLRVSFLIMIIVCSIAFILVPYFIQYVYGEEFMKSVMVNRILLIGVIIFTFFKILNGRLAGMGKPQYTFIAFIPCIILKVALNFILVPKYGINGAAWSSNISYVLASILILIIFSKVEKIKIAEVLKFRKSDFFEIKRFSLIYAGKIKSRFNRL